MAEVNLSIDGRNYGIACDDGQEQRLKQLGNYVEQRLRQVSGGGASVNKAQTMVLTTLVLADEIFDLNEKLSAAPQSSPLASGVAANGTPHVIEYQGMTQHEEQNVVNIIGQMAAKVEKLTARVQKKSA